MYDYKAIGDMIDSLRGSGNEAQAWAMFNGLSGMGNATQAAGGVAGNLDSYLRTRWGDQTAKQWVNSMDTKYGNTLFDPLTGKWGGMGQAAGQAGTIAGWDPTKYQAGGMGIGGQGYAPQGPGSGAAGFAGQTGTGLQSDMKTPMPEFGTPTGGGAPGAGGQRPGPGGGPAPYQPPGSYTPPGASAGGGAGGGAPPYAPGAGGYSNTGADGGLPTADPALLDLPNTAARPSQINDPFSLFNDEGYKFMLKEGMDAIQNSAAANGGLGSGQTLKDLAKYQTGLQSQEYGKAFDRFNTTRNFQEDQYRYGNDDEFKRLMAEAGINNSNYWNALGFNEGQRRDSRDFDYRAFLDERNFGNENDWRNRQFDYTAMLGDRTFNSQLLRDLANMGLTATGGSSNIASILASLFGANTMAGATAGAQGTTGQANNWMNLINQLLGYGMQNQYLGMFGGNGTRTP